MRCAELQPLLPARAGELTPVEARARAGHLADCSQCSREAVAYLRLSRALATMATVEVDPVEGTLERVLEALARRRGPDPRVAALAAGSVVVTLLVAGVVRQRRRAGRAPSPALRTLRTRLREPAAALAPAK